MTSASHFLVFEHAMVGPKTHSVRGSSRPSFGEATIARPGRGLDVAVHLKRPSSSGVSTSWPRSGNGGYLKITALPTPPDLMNPSRIRSAVHRSGIRNMRGIGRPDQTTMLRCG